MQKRLLTIAVAAVTGGLAFSGQAIADEKADEQQSAQAQGLYSTEDLLDAEVYLRDSPDEEVGEVEELLLDDNQKVSAFVIETGEILGMGGREIVADIENIRVESERSEDAMFGEGYVTHRVLIDANSEDLESFPEYEQNWFDEQSEELRTNFTGRSAWQGEGAAGGTWGKEGAVDDDS